MKGWVLMAARGKALAFMIFDYTLAVHSLKQMVLANKDLCLPSGIKNPWGHSFKYTAYYLRLTKDMFPDIRQKNRVALQIKCS